MDKKRIPTHIGFIIDGNGRWAQKRGLSRTKGHKAGVKTLEKIVKECFFKFGIPYVSVFAFSTENWNRPKAEIEGLESLFCKYTSGDFVKKYPNVRLNIMGDYEKFEKLADVAKETVELTKNNTKFTLNLAINYSGQDEIVKACKEIVAENPKEIDRKTIENHLYTKDQPPIDFLIRTSGELRISNFMLWQMAYAELYFPQTLWPDFGSKDLVDALENFASRNRRFGAIKEEKEEKKRKK